MLFGIGQQELQIVSVKRVCGREGQVQSKKNKNACGVVANFLNMNIISSLNHKSENIHVNIET